ncbi:unnamed protein product [Arabis nemorensis]|uniref:PGG domain-containing protein n=1 Tax=Arabis nemorensis TaxID=586526 RepID=A0A565CFC1_9BRAS|nr:unnamed protein product [Arabis nemorensis]
MNNLEGSNQYEATTSGSPSTNTEIIEDTTVDIPQTFYSCSTGPQRNFEDKLSCPPHHFHDESRDCVRLYKAALEGDWNEAYTIMRTQNEIVKEPINNKWDTALHIAVAAKHKDFVRNLLGEMYNMKNLEGSNQGEAATTETPSTNTWQ